MKTQLVFPTYFRRLYDPGDFVVEIDSADLLIGANEVRLRAMDGSGNVKERVVTVNYQSNAWPSPHVIDWDNVADPQTQVHIVDGEWDVHSGQVHTVREAYDRLVAIGGESWQNYEAEVRFVVHSFNTEGFTGFSGRPGFGLIARWTGHTDTPVVCPQPHCGWLPHGNSVWYRWDEAGGEPGSFGGTLVDPSGTFLEYGTPYIFKLRVETQGDGTHLYRFKVWPAGGTEPVGWTDTGVGDASIPNGSLLLVAHHVDASFGRIQITELP